MKSGGHKDGAKSEAAPVAKTSTSADVEDEIVGDGNNPQGSPESQNDEYDKSPSDWKYSGNPRITLTKAQWINVATLFAVLAQAFIYYITFVEVRRTANATDQAARAAQEQARIALHMAQNADRPWLKVEVEPDGPISHSINGYSFPFRFKITNVGRSAATNATIKAGLLLLGNKRRELAAEQKKLCSNALTPIAYPVFPGATYDQQIEIEVDNEDAQILKSTKESDPFLVGCVDYQFSGQPEHHQTGFMISITGTNNLLLDLSTGKDIPKERIKLVWIGYLGGAFAN